MFSSLVKYSAVLFLLNTIFFAVKGMSGYAGMIFMVFMILFAFLIVTNPSQVKQVLLNRGFSFFLALNLINITYFLFFDDFNLKSLQYLLARFVGLSIFSFSIFHNTDYFKTTFFKHLVYASALLGILCLVLAPPSLSGRYMGIVGNPNELGIVMVSGFAICYICTDIKIPFRIPLMLMFASIVLFSGSRGVIFGLALTFIIKHGFSFKLLAYGGLLAILAYMLSAYGLESGISRLSSGGDQLDNRSLEFKYAFITFLDKALEGHGLGKYAYLNQELIPVDIKSNKLITNHSGYLSVMVQYGAIFASIFFFTVFRNVYRITIDFLSYKVSPNFKKMYFFFIIYSLLSAVFEAVMTGINNFHTNILWFSMGMYLFVMYYNKEEKSIV